MEKVVKYKIGLTVSGASQKPAQAIDLFKFATSRDNSFYMVPLPSLFSGTGFHWSFHPSGVSHLRTTNPKMSVDVHMNEFIKMLSPDAYKISFEHFLRPPRFGAPALIAIISTKHVRKCLYQTGANKFLIDLQKLFDYMTLATVRDTSDLPYAIPKLRSLGYLQEGDNIIITPTELDEFSIFYDCSSHKIQNSEYLRKLGGYFFTMEKPTTGGFERLFHLPMFKPLFEPMQEFMNKLDKADVKLANPNMNNLNDTLKTEHILQKKKVLELT